MFPVGPRRPTRPVPIRRRRHLPPVPIQRAHPRVQMQNGSQQVKKNSNFSNLTTYFKNNDGNYDLDKIVVTAEQVNKLYGNVRPLLSKFLNR